MSDFGLGRVTHQINIYKCNFLRKLTHNDDSLEVSSNLRSFRVFASRENL